MPSTEEVVQLVHAQPINMAVIEVFRKGPIISYVNAALLLTLVSTTAQPLPAGLAAHKPHPFFALQAGNLISATTTPTNNFRGQSAWRTRS